MRGGYDWPTIGAAGARNRPAVLFISGMTRQLLLTGLEMLQPFVLWRGAAGELSPAERESVEAAVSAAFDEVMRMSALIGAVVAYPYSSEPEWGVFADGRTLQKADYPELWELSDNRTATDFTLPDYRDRFLVGVGSYHALGVAGGSREITLTEAQMPIHSHSYQGVIPNVDLESPGVPDIVAAGINPLPQQTGTAGGGQAHPNEPEYRGVNYVIITPKP